MKLSDGFNGADLRNVCTEAGSGFRDLYSISPQLSCMLVMRLCEGGFFVCRRGGLIVGAMDSGSSGPGSSLFRGHCVVFLGKTLYSNNAPLHPVTLHPGV